MAGIVGHGTVVSLEVISDNSLPDHKNMSRITRKTPVCGSAAGSQYSDDPRPITITLRMNSAGLDDCERQALRRYDAAVDGNRNGPLDLSVALDEQ
jgi:hypothetical protein